jgi:two-component system, chemotaxis family, protein-glutamate methylesterase/glutaminase
LSKVLVASPSTFLRIALVQQLRRRDGRMAYTESTTAMEAAKIVAGGGINVAIIDNVLLTPPNGDLLIASIERHLGCALVIATHEGNISAPGTATLRVISGVVDGTLDMGTITSSLSAAFDEVAVERGIRSRPGQPSPIRIEPDSGVRKRRRPPELILLAASTGGPSAITLLLRHFGPPRLPLLIAQHMPADQTLGFARYLASESGFDVIERGAGDVPSKAQVVVLRGGSDYRLVRGPTGLFRLVATEVAGNAFHPSADLLFGSAAAAGIAVIAVVLSGMGEDGARGAADLAAQGDRVIVQDFASCVVAGMPSAAHAACPSAVIASVPEIAERLSRWSMAQATAAAAVVEG